MATARISKATLERAVDAAKVCGSAIRIYDTELAGFGVRAAASGYISFFLEYRHGGRAKKRYKLGTAGSLTPVEARKLAKRLLGDVAKGIDIQAPRMKSSDFATGTFEDTARRFLRRYCRPNYSPRHFLETARLFGFKPGPEDPAKLVHNAYKKAFIKKWGRKPVASITEQEIVDFLNGIVDGGTPVLANNMHTALSKFFGWAKTPEGARAVAVNPCLEIKQPAKDKEGERVLSDCELRALWRAAERLGHPKGSAYRMLMLSGQRRSVVAQCRADQVALSGRLWTIPANQEGAKGTGQVLPITDTMAALFERCGGNAPYMFSTTGGARPLYLGSKIKTEVDALMVEELRKDAAKHGEDPAAIELVPWDNHDIRRTMRTRLSALPVPEGDIVRELVIGHRKKKLHKIYDKYAYLDENRIALKLWAAKLATIVDPPESG